MRRLSAEALLITIAFFITSTGQAQEEIAEPADLIIRDTTVFTGSEWLDNRTVVVTGDRISEVVERYGGPRVATELDGTGLTVIPGLIDAHLHVLDRRSENAATPWVLRQLENLLDMGVTSIQSTSDPTDEIVELRARIESNAVRGPRLFVTGAQIGAVGGPKQVRCGPGTLHCGVIEVGDEADANEAVSVLRNAGVDAVKLVVDHEQEAFLSVELVRAIIESAHASGLRVFGHVDYSADTRAAVESGLDVILHPVPWRAGAPDEVADLLANRGVPVTTTLSLRYLYLGHDDEMVAAFGAPYPEGRFRLFKHGLSVVRAMHEAGVMLAVGTDNNLVVEHPPIEEKYLRELQILVEAGLSTTEALQAATLNAATVIGREDLGAIKPESIADLVVLRGDPRNNILELETVELVIKSGEVVVDNRVR